MYFQILTDLILLCCLTHELEKKCFFLNYCSRSMNSCSIGRYLQICGISTSGNATKSICELYHSLWMDTRTSDRLRHSVITAVSLSLNASGDSDRVALSFLLPLAEMVIKFIASQALKPTARSAFLLAGASWYLVLHPNIGRVSVSQLAFVLVNCNMGLSHYLSCDTLGYCVLRAFCCCFASNGPTLRRFE